MSFHNEEEDEADKGTGMLLNLSQKSGIFVADQTPTPTRLIKNCEEVGLFEDLRNVNPFDETFRRACEQNVQHTPRSHQQFHNDENSLHTPQVFPQFDTAVEGGIVASEDLTKQILDTPVVLDVESVENILDIPSACVKPKSTELSAIKYRAIAEKPAQTHQTGFTCLPSCVQFVQPQFIAVTFPNAIANTQDNTNNQQQQQHDVQKKKKLTKSKPFLLPKLSTANIISTKDSVATNISSCTHSDISTQSIPHPEPSSASLTPTSQLPIKERLKAILNQTNRIRTTDWSDKSYITRNFKSSSQSNAQKSSKDDVIERKRAASTRYRHKMRNEYKELRKRNTDLQVENNKLKDRVKLLENENSKLKSASLLGVPPQIEIPASTIHLVMNIPNLVIPCVTNDLNTSAKLKNSLSYRLDKS